jgi:hypothetical protein
MRVPGKLLVLGSILLLGPAARAQSAAPPAVDRKPPEGLKPTAPPEVAMPRPPAELQQLKLMAGSWRCEGKAGPAGHEMPVKSTYKVAPDLDGFFLVGRNEAPRTKAGPGYVSVDYYSHDGTGFVSTSFDSYGAITTMRAKGWDGDRMEWAGKARFGGEEVDTKQTVTRKGDREVRIAGGLSGPMPASWDVTCKK